MEPVVHTLYQSGFYTICDFRCTCMECNTSAKEYTALFSLCFVRSGNFNYHIFRDTLDTYTGYALVNKPGYEYTVTHPAMLPDHCTVIRFTDTFYQRLITEHLQGRSGFFHNPDRPSTLIKTGPGEEYLHRHLIHHISHASVSRLEADTWVMELLAQVTGGLQAVVQPPITSRQKKAHLYTIERAKEYIADNLCADLSLDSIAGHCCVSPFHFARIFRTFTGTSPHQYLLATRLKHAALLLRAGKPVADAAYLSGFNSLEHFSATFSKRYTVPPSRFREGC